MRRANRVTRQQAARYLTYCLTQLEDPSITDERREILAGKADHFRRLLVGSCSSCGRTLTDPDSVRLGIGPECRQRVAS